MTMRKVIAEFADEMQKAQEHPECVRCGECCKAAACAFGEWVEYPKERQEKPWDHAGQCKHLLPLNICGTDITLYTCGIYDQIQQDPSSIVSPAFGAGCCRSLFNEARDRILEVVR